MALERRHVDDQRSAEIHPLYWDLVKQVVEAAPSTKDLILQISQYILDGKLYQALKHAKKLISYEQELIQNVSKSD
ncbi:MAG: hypothetical protein HGA85_07160 [Nanoarchaeota archaeon]|nr:hypothetical protein [Nanoarchaeota archaeon]